MRRLMIVLFFFWADLIRKVRLLRWRLHRAALRSGYAILHYCSYRRLFVMAHLARYLRMTDKNQRYRSRVAEENYRCLLGPDPRFDYTWVAQRRMIIEMAATRGQNTALMREIEACAATLRAFIQVEELKKKPVILAPMHSVSDILAVIIGARATQLPVSVIVSSNADEYQRKDRELGGITNITYCSIHDAKENRASRLITDCMDAISGNRHFLIFPDMTPEYTAQTSSGKMETAPCRMFGRPAVIHSGITRIARLLSANTLCYTLYYDRGIKIHIDRVIHADQLADRLPENIETSIRRFPQDWLLWHMHSLYFYND